MHAFCIQGFSLTMHWSKQTFEMLCIKNVPRPKQFAELAPMSVLHCETRVCTGLAVA